ncbi:MAG: phosphatase PAP2 family protein [bacterium]|nr:phosphatase PAP2 family protein [bacterium]
MDALFIFGAKYLFLISILIGLIWFIYLPRSLKKSRFIFGVLSSTLTFLIGKTSSYFYFNARPFVVGKFTPLIEHAPNNGFPSDHTLLVAVIASIIFIFNKRLGLALGFIALFVGFSRIYTGVHHSLDILGSFIIAIISSVIVFILLKNRKML